MGVSDGIITAPINASDPYVCMGLGQYNGWWDIGYICSNKHGRINMWSRYKPVHIANALEVNRDTLWYRGTNNDCGITPKSTMSYSQLPTFYINGESEWTYMPPWGDRGGIVNSPYRLLDFWKYKHNAIAPISRFSCPNKVSRNGTFTCDVLLAEDRDEDESEMLNPGSLSLKEIMRGGVSLNDWYLGAVVTDTSGKVMFFASGNELSDGTFGHGFPKFSTNTLIMGYSYYVYPFLSMHPQGQYGAVVANEFLTIPDSSRGEIKVVSETEIAGIKIDVMAEYHYRGSTRVSVSGSYTIECTSRRTFTNNYLHLRFNADGSALTAGEFQRKLPDFTVQSGEKYTEPFIFTLDRQYATKDYYVRLSLNSSQYVSITQPLEAKPHVLPDLQ